MRNMRINGVIDECIFNFNSLSIYWDITSVSFFCIELL